MISLVIAAITFALMLYVFFSIPRTIYVGDNINFPSPYIFYAIYVFSLLGIVMSSISFLRKEPSTWSKWVGAFLNLFFFLMLMGSIAFAALI